MKRRLLLLTALVLALPACQDTGPTSLPDLLVPGGPEMDIAAGLTRLYGQVGSPVGPSPMIDPQFGYHADDFRIDAGLNWDITHVAVFTTIFVDTATFDLFIVVEDSEGRVTVVHEFPALVAEWEWSNDAGGNRFLLVLPGDGVNLEGGRYWLSVTNPTAPSSEWLGTTLDGGTSGFAHFDSLWNRIATVGQGLMFEVFGSSQGTPIPDLTFNLSGLPPKTYGDPPFSVAEYASTSSSSDITFATALESVGCSVSEGLVTILNGAVAPEACILVASVVADGYWDAASVSASFEIAKAVQSISISNMPLSPTVGDYFTPEYDQTIDGGTPSVTSWAHGTCTVDDGVVRFVGPGWCTLEASATETANYQAATGPEQLVRVTGISTHSCTFTINARNGQRQVTVAWDNAVPGVTQIQLIDGRTITKQMAPTTTGSWSTNVKSDPASVLTYAMRGGYDRRDTSVELVPPTECKLEGES
jgi:hypothetical protein